jgi:hypothetical protein
VDKSVLGLLLGAIVWLIVIAMGVLGAPVKMSRLTYVGGGFVAGIVAMAVFAKLFL